MATIEDFFIKEYEKLVEENKQLKEELDKYNTTGADFGIYDLQEPVELIEVSIHSGYSFWKDTGLNKQELKDLLNLDDEEFIKKCKTIRDEKSSWYKSYALKEEETRYRYTIEIRDMDGVHRYAVDDTKGTDLINLNNKQVGVWCDKCFKDLIYKEAITRLKDAITDTITYIERNESENENAE